MFKLFLIASLQFTAGALAAAQGSECAKFLDIFSKAYFTGYCPRGSCRTNVLQLIAFASRETVLDQKTTILFIQNKNRETTIKPRLQRNPRITEWFYHYVLVVDKKILDFDYKNSPEAVPIDEYFFNMFPGDHNNLIVRKIPAHEFTNPYPELTFKDYPPAPLKQFLEE